MKSLLAVIPVLAIATSAIAQEAPDESKKDLWCGLAFGIVSADAPQDADPATKAMVEQFRDGGLKLVEQAKAVHLESGYTEETYTAYVTTLTEDIRKQVTETPDSALYSFEDCRVLLDL
jgi:hypothetical protein